MYVEKPSPSTGGQRPRPLISHQLLCTNVLQAARPVVLKKLAFLACNAHAVGMCFYLMPSIGLVWVEVKAFDGVRAFIVWLVLMCTNDTATIYDNNGKQSVAAVETTLAYHFGA